MGRGWHWKLENPRKVGGWGGGVGAQNRGLGAGVLGVWAWTGPHLTHSLSLP